MSAIAAVRKLGTFTQSVQAELAETKQKLADALAAPPANNEAIAQAQAEADAAKAKVAELQALVDADTAEDADIVAIVDSVIPPAPPVE